MRAARGAASFWALIRTRACVQAWPAAAAWAQEAPASTALGWAAWAQQAWAARGLAWARARGWLAEVGDAAVPAAAAAALAAAPAAWPRLPLHPPCRAPPDPRLTVHCHARRHGHGRRRRCWQGHGPDGHCGHEHGHGHGPGAGPVQACPACRPAPPGGQGGHGHGACRRAAPGPIQGPRLGVGCATGLGHVMRCAAPPAPPAALLSRPFCLLLGPLQPDVVRALHRPSSRSVDRLRLSPLPPGPLGAGPPRDSRPPAPAARDRDRPPMRDWVKVRRQLPPASPSLRRLRPTLAPQLQAPAACRLTNPSSAATAPAPTPQPSSSLPFLRPQDDRGPPPPRARSPPRRPRSPPRARSPMRARSPPRARSPMRARSPPRRASPVRRQPEYARCRASHACLSRGRCQATPRSQMRRGAGAASVEGSWRCPCRRRYSVKLPLHPYQQGSRDFGELQRRYPHLAVPQDLSEVVHSWLQVGGLAGSWLTAGGGAQVRGRYLVARWLPQQARSWLQVGVSSAGCCCVGGRESGAGSGQSCSWACRRGASLPAGG
jgi:hypothetical protein